MSNKAVLFLRNTTDFKTLFFTAFLTVGSISAFPGRMLLGIPVEFLSSFFMYMMILVTLIVLFQRRFLMSKSLIWMLGLTLCFAIVLFWTDPTPYGKLKISRLFSNTLIVFITPFFFLKTRNDLRYFFNALTFLSILHVSTGFHQLLSFSSDPKKLMTLGSTTIILARSCGVAFVWIAILTFYRKINIYFGATCLFIIWLVLIGTGSRGPLLFLPVSLFLPALLLRQISIKTVVLIALTLGLIALLTVSVVDFLPESSVTRIVRFLEHGPSSTNRVNAFYLSMEIIKKNPLGVGWSGFDRLSNFYSYDQLGVSDRIKWSHNLFLELFSEAGWMTGLYFIFLLFIVFHRLMFQSFSVEKLAAFSYFLFFLGNAMVSGDINQNRYVFLMISVVLSVGWNNSSDSSGA